jgi:hypothetical protein
MEHVPSITSTPCNYGFGNQKAEHIIIYCRNFSAAMHALRDNQDRLPNYKQLVTIPTGFKTVTRWVTEREMLSQYQRASGQFYPLGPPSSANNIALL